MRQRVIKYVCDRCGKTKFYEVDSDGSFKEPCTFHLLDIKVETHLCDECEYERRKRMDDFMKEKKEND